MIGYDAAWGVKRMDARAAYQKPGRVMFIRESRVGNGADRLQASRISDVLNQDGTPNVILLNKVLDSLEAGLNWPNDGQVVDNDPELLVLVDWEDDKYDSGAAQYLGPR